MRNVFLAVLLFSLLPLMVHAQAAPDEVVRSVIRTVENHDWKGLADLVDPDRLVEFRRRELGMLVEWAQRREEIAAAIRDRGGYGMSGIDSLTDEMITAVADVPVKTFSGSQTIGRLASLTPKQFFIEWCVAAERKDRTDELPRGMIDAKRQVVGGTTVSDTQAYVIYRQEVHSAWGTVFYIDQPGRPFVMPLKRSAGSWRVLLNEDVVGHLSFSDVLPIDFPKRGGLGRSPRTERRVTPRPELPPGSPRARRTASDAASAAFQALERGDYRAVALLVHPKMLADFQRMQIQQIVMWASTRDQQAQESTMLMVDLETVTDDVIKQFANVRVPIFRDSPTIGQLAAASPVDFFAMWCEVVFGRGAAALLGEPPEEFRPRRIIGEIAEGSALAHVLYEPGSSFRYDDRWRVTRMPMMRAGDDWGLLLNDDIGERTILGLHLMLLDHPEALEPRPPEH